MCDTKRVYKLLCVNCGKYYNGQMNRNFKTSFKKLTKDFICFEGHSSITNYVVEEGHEMRNMDGIVTIL